ncbi:putative transcription factor C2H2 family [Dioscorea sansibarensis]
MASSVARMPAADEWRASAFTHPSFSNPLKLRVRIPSSDPNDDLNLNKDRVPSSASQSQRRQSRIVDRWTPREPREIAVTIERQAHQAEISALTTISQPVSARAASFLRDTSPGLSECPGNSVDLPRNVRASSLIQMWREIEAESVPTPTPRATGDSGTNVVVSTSPDEPSVISNDPEAYGGWDSDNAASELANAPMLPESEGSRVGHIVKLLSSGSQKPSSEENGSDESEQLGGDGLFSGLARLRIKRRYDIEGLMARMDQERRMELDTLRERQAVSRFSHRGRIQTLLRLMLLRREVSAEAQERHSSKPAELNQLQTRSTIVVLREKFNLKDQQEREVRTAENSGSSHIELQINSQVSCDSGLNDQFPFDENACEEALSSRDSESTPPEPNSPQPGNKDRYERSPTPDFSWEERSLDGSNIDWGRPSNSSSHSWQAEAVIQEPEPHIPQSIVDTECTWMSTPQQWGGLVVSGRALPDYFLENFSENVEIRELLQRPVSTSLASDFRDRMDKLMLSLLRKQAQQCYYDENFAAEDDEQPVWRQNIEFHDANQVASSSLVPLPFQTVRHPGNWEQASVEMETGNDLRSEIAQIHNEIRDLRKLVESCMEWQVRLLHSVKPEVSAAVSKSVKIENTSHNSNQAPTKKGNCYICYEMQVDTLLYRCGHMCTCFKCAHELLWSSGRCPVCRALIVDVVKAYSNF